MTEIDRLCEIALNASLGADGSSGIPIEPLGEYTSVPIDGRINLDAAVRALLTALKEPSEGMRFAGLEALAQEMEKRRQDWERPEMQEKIREEYKDSDYPIISTCALMLLNEGQSNRIWQAMIDHLLQEKEQGE